MELTLVQCRPLNVACRLSGLQWCQRSSFSADLLTLVINWNWDLKQGFRLLREKIPRQQYQCFVLPEDSVRSVSFTGSRCTQTACFSPHLNLKTNPIVWRQGTWLFSAIFRFWKYTRNKTGVTTNWKHMKKKWWRMVTSGEIKQINFVDWWESGISQFVSDWTIVAWSCVGSFQVQNPLTEGAFLHLHIQVLVF